MKKCIIIILLLSIPLTGCGLAFAAPEVDPEVRHNGREAYVGVRLTWRFGGPTPVAQHAPAPRTVYVEQYRYLSSGRVSAQADGGAIDDTGGRVIETADVPVAPSFGEAVAAHLRRNVGKYIAIAAAGGLYAIGDHYGWWGSDRSSSGSTSSQPTTYSPRRSPTVNVVAGDQSPVNVTVTITEQEMAE